MTRSSSFSRATQAVLLLVALALPVAGIGPYWTHVGAIAWYYALLAASWVEQGRIAAASPPEPSRRAYWLVAPLPQWRQKKVKALVAALTA